MMKLKSIESKGGYRLLLRFSDDACGVYDFTPFVEAGAAALIFDPKDAAGIDTQTRAGFVYGGGADFDFTRHVFLRAEYRGFVYDSPTYNLTALQGTDRITHRAEPSIGFGYRF